MYYDRRPASGFFGNFCDGGPDPRGSRAESQSPNPANAAGFGHCPPAGGWLRWNHHRLDEAQAGKAAGTIAITPVFYAIIATGIALAGLILNNQRATAELRKELKALDEKLSRRVKALGERIARLEGFMQGIRDAIAGKTA